MRGIRRWLARFDDQPYEWWRSAIILLLVLTGVWTWYDAVLHPWIPNACEQLNIDHLGTGRFHPCTADPR